MILYFIECLAAMVSDEKVQLEFTLSINNPNNFQKQVQEEQPT